MERLPLFDAVSANWPELVWVEQAETTSFVDWYGNPVREWVGHYLTTEDWPVHDPGPHGLGQSTTERVLPQGYNAVELANGWQVWCPGQRLDLCDGHCFPRLDWEDEGAGQHLAKDRAWDWAWGQATKTKLG